MNPVADRRMAGNVRRNPHLAVMSMDEHKPYRWLDVGGVVEEIAEDSDLATTNAHARLYKGVDDYFGDFAPMGMKGKEKHVVLRIKPERVVAFPSRNKPSAAGDHRPDGAMVGPVILGPGRCRGRKPVRAGDRGVDT